MIYIYTLSDPRTGEIRYVGKTTNPKQRKHNHSNKARDQGTYKRNWIESLRKQGLRPIFEILDIVPDNWQFWEQYWIAQCISWGFRLTNHTIGGDGLTTRNATTFKKGQIPWNYNTAHTKICAVCQKSFKVPPAMDSKRQCCSHKCSIIYRKNTNNYKGTFVVGHNRAWNKGIKGLKLKPDKNVHQYTLLEKQYIQTWNTAKQAAITLGINEGAIGQCARGCSKSSGGYYWTYKLL